MGVRRTAMDSDPGRPAPPPIGTASMSVTPTACGAPAEASRFAL